MTENEFNEYFQNMIHGNIDSFSNIYEDTKKPVYTIIFRILGNRDDSEDIMQDLYLKLFNLPPETNISKPRAYIFSMARNMAYNQLRKKTSDELNEDYVDVEYSNMEDIICTNITLNEAMKKLSRIDIDIISLKINGDLKFREIANIVHLPIGTVLSKYYSAIKKIKNELK